MKRNTLLLLLLAVSCYNALLNAANKEMPIIAYWGVPEEHTSEYAFRTFSECGFTVSIFPYSSLTALVNACRIADKYGIKILGRCPELAKSHVKAATTLKNEAGFYGYYIQDEPDAPQIHQRKKEIERLKQHDSSHPFYINLFPYYNPDWVEPSLKTKSYGEYLRAASSTPCQQISFDFYPVTTKGIRPTWYHNMEMIRQESLNSGKPFWGFVLCTPHDVPYDEGNYYPSPTMSSLRLQVYINLAYGAQAIQYFTYWTPDGNTTFHFHDGPIGLDGKKTKTYTLVQQMNRELKQVAPLFYGAKVTSVKHLGIIPQGTSKLTTMPRNLSSLKVVSSKGAIVSQLTKNKHHYLAIVNKNHWDPMTVLIRAKNSTPRHVTKSLTTEPMKTTYTVAAGDILLFRLQ